MVRKVEMIKRRQKLSLRKLGVALGIAGQIYSPVVFAESRALSAVAPSGSLTAKMESSIAMAIVKPSPLNSEQHFYNTFVADSDSRIYREYRDRWDYHEQQAVYTPAVARNQKHVNAGTLEFHDNALGETEYRAAFAMQVLQIRLQKGLENFIKTWNGLKDLKSVETTLRVLQQAQTQTISFVPSGPAARPSALAGSVRFGYDIFTDFSKFEYTCNALDFGFYHNRFLGASSPLQERSFYSQFTLKPANAALPTPMLRYRIDAPALELGVSKALNHDLSASIATTQPLRTGADPSYGMSVAYRF